MKFGNKLYEVIMLLSRKLLFLFFFILLLQSCFPPPRDYRQELYDSLNSYKGKHYSVLLEHMGAPTQTYEDGKGGKILQFPLRWYDEMHRLNFYVDSDGMVYKWNIK